MIATLLVCVGVERCDVVGFLVDVPMLASDERRCAAIRGQPSSGGATKRIEEAP